MVRRISVSLTKGGVGKTTTAAHLAHGIAKRGRRVLLVDCDTQGQAASILGVNVEAGLADLLNGEKNRDRLFTLARKNLTLLGGGFELVDTKKRLDRMDSGSETVLSKALEPLERSFEYVILDTAPGYDALSVNAWFYAQEIVMPVSLAALSVKGLLDFAKRLQMMRSQGLGINRMYVLPTFHNDRVAPRKEIGEILSTYFSKHLCSPIRSDVTILAASAKGKTVFEYAEGSNAAKDYWKFANKVIEDEP